MWGSWLLLEVLFLRESKTLGYPDSLNNNVDNALYVICRTEERAGSSAGLFEVALFTADLQCPYR